MSTAVWRPSRDESYPVIGVEGYDADGLHAEIVTHMPGWVGPDRAKVPLTQIVVRPRSVVRALTAQFVDHSDARRCGCGERASGAQASAAGDAAEAPNFPAAIRTAHTQRGNAVGDSASSSSQRSSDPQTERAAAGSSSDTAKTRQHTHRWPAVSDSTTP